MASSSVLDSAKAAIRQKRQKKKISQMKYVWSMFSPLLSTTHLQVHMPTEI